LDGLYSNSIKFVKEYCKLLKYDLKVSTIYDVGLRSIFQLLADKDLTSARILLNHMKFDSNDKIFQICFLTPHREMRNFLLDVLIDKNKLKDEEKTIKSNLLRIESAYPNMSLESAKENLKKFQQIYINFKNNNTSGSTSRKSTISRNDNPNFVCKDLHSIRKMNKNSSSRYSHLVIDWLRYWSDEMKHNILIDSYILNETKIDDFTVDPHLLWSVLLEQNNTSLCLEWINLSFDHQQQHDSFSHWLFKNHKINQDMIDEIITKRYLVDGIKDILLNSLAKYNQFCSKESINGETMLHQNFNHHLARLISSSTLIDKERVQTRGESFENKFIFDFLLKKNSVPFYFLWLYVNFLTKFRTSEHNYLGKTANFLNFHPFLSF
jgi:hypothetical protein